MTKKGIVSRGALIAHTIALSAGQAIAQAGHGKARINGVVVDESGNPIPKAKITAVFTQDQGSTFETKANAEGKWSLNGVGTGPWSIMAAAQGYTPATISYFVKQLERNAPITITMAKAVVGSGVVQDEKSFEALDQGNAFFKDGKYDTALVMYEEFPAKNPAAYQVLLNIGDCYREKSDYEQALANCNKLIERAKTDTAMGTTMGAKGLAAIGLCYLKQDNFDQAQDSFKKSIEMSPQDETLPYNVGEICFSNQKIDDALKYFNLAAQIKPDWPDPYYNLGLVYLNMGDMAKAAESLAMFIKLEPDTPRTAQAKTILASIKK
jgi:tetratricopeptide (TPR) repeat protein